MSTYALRRKFRAAFSQLLFIGLICAAGSVLAKAPEIPLPDDTRVTTLGESMRVNGNEVFIRTFRSDESAQDFVDFYRDEWGETGNSDPGYTVNNFKDPWTIISRIEDGYLLTVQVQSDGDDGSIGTLAVSRLPDGDRKVKLADGFPSMGGSDVLNEVASKDLGQSGRTMMLSNKHDLSTNVDFYRGRYGEDGWAVDMDRSLGGFMHILALRKARERLNLVLSKNNKGGTLIVATEVKHDLL